MARVYATLEICPGTRHQRLAVQSLFQLLTPHRSGYGLKMGLVQDTPWGLVQVVKLPPLLDPLLGTRRFKHRGIISAAYGRSSRLAEVVANVKQKEVGARALDILGKWSHAVL